MDDMRVVEGQIASELEHLNKVHSIEIAAKVLEMTQREIHHRETMRMGNALMDCIDELRRVLEHK